MFCNRVQGWKVQNWYWQKVWKVGAFSTDCTVCLSVYESIHGSKGWGVFTKKDPCLRQILGLKNNALHKICISGTVGGPLLTWKPQPACT